MAAPLLLVCSSNSEISGGVGLCWHLGSITASAGSRAAERKHPVGGVHLGRTACPREARPTDLASSLGKTRKCQ